MMNLVFEDEGDSTKIYRLISNFRFPNLQIK